MTSEPREALTVEARATPALELELEPEPVRAPATIAAPPSPAAVRDRGGADSPLDKILQLKHLGITNEELREFLAMQREWEAHEAKRAYDQAMAAWKADGIPAIPKALEVDYINGKGQRVHYFHEDLADVVATVLPLMARHGLSHKWQPKQTGAGEAQLITVRTVVTHTSGHSEGVELYASPDASGGKNSIQAIKSTVSYLERIGLLALLGLAAKGQDNDGADGAPPPRSDPRDDFEEPPSSSATRSRGKPETAPPQATSSAPSGLISEKQVGLLVARLRERGIDRGEFCEAHQVPGLEDLPRSRMDAALAWIGQQRARA